MIQQSSEVTSPVSTTASRSSALVEYWGSSFKTETVPKQNLLVMNPRRAKQTFQANIWNNDFADKEEDATRTY